MAAGVKPFGSPLGHRLLADPLELTRDRIVDLAKRTRLGRGDLIHHLIARVTPEGLPASQELVQNHTEAEEIRSAVDPVPFTAGLLGSQRADETVTDTLQSANVILPFVP